MVILHNIYISSLISYPAYITSKRDKIGAHYNKDIALINFIVQSLRVSKNHIQTLYKIKKFKGSITYDDIYKYVTTFYHTDGKFMDILKKIQTDFANIIKKTFDNESYILRVEHENYLNFCGHISISKECMAYRGTYVLFFLDNIKDYLVYTYLSRIKIDPPEIDDDLKELCNFKNVSNPYKEEYLIFSPTPKIIEKFSYFIEGKVNDDFYYIFRRPSGKNTKFPLHHSCKFYKFFDAYSNSLKILKNESKYFMYEDENLHCILHNFFYFKNNKNHLRALADHILYFKYDVFFDKVYRTTIDIDYIKYYFNYLSNYTYYPDDIDQMLLRGANKVHMNILLMNIRDVRNDITDMLPEYIINTYNEKYLSNLKNLQEVYFHYVENNIFHGYNERLDVFSDNERTNDYIRFLKHHYKKMYMSM